MKELRKYFEILELDEGASAVDIKRAYLRLKKLYTKESIATLPLFNEFSDENREKVLDQIEKAYEKLSGALGIVSGGKHGWDKDVNEYIESISVFTGGALAKIREMKGITVKEAAEATKIGSRYIGSIEDESFKKMPAEIYTKGFVRSYAEYLQLDSDKVVEDIMNIYRNR